jgi:5-methylcytosine-specific restriction protein B
VIVSRGNQQFRTIGEFVGDYEFKPRPEGGYAHRRTVRWLWVDRAGVPVSEIYGRLFMQQSIYIIHERNQKTSAVNVPALERYMNSQRSDGGDEPDQFVLIIDEINRANISKVFGELITLLEADKRLNQPNAVRVRLPYSGDEFGVPSNLHILGTMNTADRSIALLDTALRRRFTFSEMMPDTSILESAAKKCAIDLPRLLTTINERIEYLYDREHQIGHAYFTACRSRADVDEVMRHKVIPLLAEYFFEDWAKIAAVLGDLEPHDGPISGGFLKRAILKAPPGIGDGEATPRFRWQVRSVDEGFDYSRLVGT